MKTLTLIAAATLAALLGSAGTASAASLNQVLSRNGQTAERIAADARRGELSRWMATALEQRVAHLYADEAQVLAMGGDADAWRHIAREQRYALRAADEVNPAGHGPTGLDPLDRMHMRVAASRQAEQQRWVAREFHRGQLTTEQVAQIEAQQARIARVQAALDRGGQETVDQALRVQHLQDLQDWAIRTAHTA